jgi:hypothetical protein
LPSTFAAFLIWARTGAIDGDLVGVIGAFGQLDVPVGYVSDGVLSDTSTYAGKTFTSLGVTPGTYKWTWGTGTNQNSTLDIGTAVPEPSTWAMMLLGLGRSASSAIARHAATTLWRKQAGV